jgi:exopolysaccharide production protein ExoZ
MLGQNAVVLRSNINSIQALRGIAALMVMAFHLNNNFDVGQAGVDLFFVISGFIMGMVGIDERPGEFLRKRIARIAPLYWLVTGAMCLGEQLGFFRNFTFDTRSLLLSLFFVPYFSDKGWLYPLLVPGWTLNYEMFFYFVFAVGLWLRRPVPTTLILLAAATGMGAVLNLNSAIGITWTSPLLLEFLAGLLLSQAQGRLPGAWIGLLLLVLGIAGLAFGVPIRQALGGDYRVVTWGIPAFAVVSGALMIEYAGRWPGKLIWPLAKLGDISYSLYLVHTLVIAIGHRFLGDNVAASIVIVAGTIAVATGCFHFVEKPSAKRARRLFAQLAGTVKPASPGIKR